MSLCCYDLDLFSCKVPLNYIKTYFDEAVQIVLKLTTEAGSRGGGAWQVVQ